MVKPAKTACSLVGIALLAGGFWLILPAYGMITVGVWCIVVGDHDQGVIAVVESQNS